MIDKKSLENSTGIAQRLTDSGVVLDVMDQTALQHLTGAMKFIPKKAETAEEACQLVKDAAQGIEHDGTMGFIADNAAVSVLNTHRLVTDVINPHIRRVVDDVIARFDAEAAKESVQDNGVKLVSLPQVMDHADLESLITRIADMDRYDVDMVDLGKYTANEILDLIKYTNSNNFDEVLKMELVNGDGSFDAINAIFSGNLFDPAKMSKETLVAALLMTQGLKHSDTIKEGINASLVDYKNCLHYIAVTIARYLKVIYNEWNVITSGRFIYRPGSKKSGNVEIISSTFTELATKHNVTIEHILGNDILDRKYGYSDFVGEHSEAVLEATKAAYDRKLATENIEKENKENDFIIRTALVAIQEDSRQRAEDPVCLEILGDTKASMINRATAACEAVYKSKKVLRKDQLDEFVAGLLIAIYYAHTDALLYLDSITDFAKQYPEMDGVELAKLARTNLVVHWVHRQLATVIKEPKGN